MCVQDPSRVGGQDKKCSGGGYKEDTGIGYWDPWIEFRPTYFGGSNLGFSYFFSFNRSSTTLLDYPLVGEKTDIEIDRIAFNPILFYNFGKRYIKGKEMSFRIGFGGALNYITKFNTVRQSTKEEFGVDTKLKPGTSGFLEFNYDWFTLRIESSQIEYEGKKFANVKKDTLVVINNKASFYYSYYFK